MLITHSINLQLEPYQGLMINILQVLQEGGGRGEGGGGDQT